MPVYNEAKFICQSIDSLLRQKHRPVELVILDNCSTDGTTELIQSSYQGRLTHIVHSKNLGAEQNFNLCIDYASGEYTCIYHGDDIYHEDIISKQFNLLENNSEVGAVFSLAKYINEEGDEISSQNLSFQSIDSIYDLNELISLTLKNSNFLICPSLMIRTSLLKRLGRWDWSFKSSADLEMWFRIAEKFKVGVLNKHLISYRISQKQWSQSVRNGIRRADFFIVTEHYLKKYKKNITEENINDYRYLKIKDFFKRIKNSKKISKSLKLFKLFLLTLMSYRAPAYKKIALLILFITTLSYSVLKILIFD